MNLNEARGALRALQEKMSAYDHAMGSIYYDGSTTAPRETAANRGHALGILSEESYRLSTSEETFALLSFLDGNKDELTTKERREVEEMYKELSEMRKIPMEEFVAFQKLQNEADDVWHRAKEADDFAMFEPFLEQIFATMIRFAGYVAPEKHPYDYWLDKFEDGLTMETCDRFFEALRARIVPLLKKVAAAKQVDGACLRGAFPKEKQETLSYWLMETMGLDLGHVGLSTTEHPFTTSLGSHLDERITTHYHEDRFDSSMFSVIHEGGHALYDTGSDDSLVYSVLDGGVSMGIHESQSRFYENLLGRSSAFIGFVYPKLCELFPSLSAFTPEDVFRAVNKTEPSLIRTEADEVTYSLHIMIRYELEKRVMSGELPVKDLPAEWNRLYRELLGIEVPSDREGVLQDTHWSGGMIGYFPSYALGSAYGAQFLAKMKETVDVEGCLARGDFGPINDWNREHIWKYGSLKKPDEILRDVVGTFDPSYYTDYLEAKVREVYGL